MRRLRTRLARDDGFTIIEVLVAALILVLGALATFMTFASAIHNVQRGKETQVGISVAQREMEKIRSLPYASVAMKAPPAASTGAGDPNARVSGTSFNLNRKGAASYAPLDYPVTGETAGSVEPSSAAFSVGGTPVTVYRYVVWRKDSAYCATGENSKLKSCEEGKNFKRVIVAVWLSQASNEHSRRPYYELQSDFVNPSP